MAKEAHQLKMAIMSGASRALKIKQKNPNATEQEILHEVMRDADLILEAMDETA